MGRSAALASCASALAVGLSWLAPGCGDTSSDVPPGAEAGASLGSYPNPSDCVPLAACVSSSCPPSTDGGFSCWWSCGQPTLCADAHFASAGSGCGSSGCSGAVDAAVSYTTNAANVKCVLAAMRDGTVGEISWGTSASDGAFNTIYQENWNIISGREAYGWWSYDSDSYAYGRYQARQLKPASFFDTCLASNDTGTWLGCLQDAFEACP